MAKSAIYTVNTNTQALAAGSAISLGSVQRRFGQNIRLDGNSIHLCGSGYYNIDANVTITATTAGTVGVTIYKDNTALVGAISNVSVAVGDVVTVPVQAIVREFGCCCDNSSNITLVLTGTSETVSNVSVTVEKM